MILYDTGPLVATAVIFARHLHREGSIGRIVRLGTGGVTAVALDDNGDGGIAWAADPRGVFNTIRVTRINRDGTFGPTTTLGRNDTDMRSVTIGVAPRGPLTVA